MDEKTAIQIADVGKTFRLPLEKAQSVKSLFINFYKHNRAYEKQVVLRNIDLNIKKGEFFGIVGRNGSGKSTLLKLLAGIYSPTAGRIHINGKLTPFIELGVGFNAELTGRENIYLNGSLLGITRKEMARMYEDIVEFAELERFMDQKLKNYSSGMQVRLAFSVAIRVNKDILLLDEVLAVGDAAFQKKCYDYFMELKRNKQTVVLVTHDMGAVRQYCDRAIMIDAGKIVATGTAEKVAQAYQRMFSKEIDSQSGQVPMDERRWGNGKMKADSCKVTVTKNELTIKCVYRAQEPLPPPIVGFTIFGPAGKDILESNTLRMKRKTQALQKGDKIYIDWSVPNIFANGNYQISIACCDRSTTEFYDWLNDAAHFTINNENQTAGVVDPPVRILKLSGNES